MPAEYPLSIPQADFIPFGEEGEVFVVHGWVPECLFLQGVLAWQVECLGFRELNAYLDEPVPTWYPDDSDKPDAVWQRETAEAYLKPLRGRVLYGWARWMQEGETDEQGYVWHDGGVKVDVKERFRTMPGWEPATFLFEH